MTEQEVTDFLATQVRAWQQGQTEPIAQAFAAQGVFLAPGFSAIGPQQIATAAADYFKHYHKLKVQVRHIWIQEQRVALEWDWSDTKIDSGETITTREAVMIDFDQAGKVLEWREYFSREKPTPSLEQVVPTQTLNIMG